MPENTIGGVPCPPEPCPKCRSLEWNPDYATDERGNTIGFCTKCGHHDITKAYK